MYVKLKLNCDLQLFGPLFISPLSVLIIMTHCPYLWLVMLPVAHQQRRFGSLAHRCDV